MSRRLWRCRNPACGAVLGRIAADGGLVVLRSARQVGAYFDSGKATVSCLACGTTREFRGRYIRADVALAPDQ